SKARRSEFLRRSGRRWRVAATMESKEAGMAKTQLYGSRLRSAELLAYCATTRWRGDVPHRRQSDADPVMYIIDRCSGEVL
ncbi:MAG: hypothetical protein WBV60_20460, partial [Terriglobales bacterium]